VAMFLGRFLPIVLVLALAGLLARQAPRETTETVGAQSVGDAATVDPERGLLPTHGVLYGVLLTGTVVLVAGLTFLPALALGPIAEALR